MITSRADVFGFGKGKGKSAAERSRDLAVSVHRAILDAGLHVAELTVAADDSNVTVTGTCRSQVEEAVRRVVATSAPGLRVELDLEIDEMEFFSVGPFWFERMPPAGADQLQKWEALADPFDDDGEDELDYDPGELTDFFNDLATAAGVPGLSSFTWCGDADDESETAWHASADGLKTLEGLFAIPESAFEELEAPGVGKEIWIDAWTVLKAARRALAIAAKHGIRFSYYDR